ncbi:MAG: hypothetical protein AB1546_15275 [bacterium]
MEQKAHHKKPESQREAVSRFYRILDELEDFFDRGFFLSFIGKIIVDEKKVYSLLNELRSLTPEAMKAADDVAPSAPSATVVETAPPPPATPAPVEASEIINHAEEEAQRIREGADRYANEVLAQLEEKLDSILAVIRKGREVIQERLF